MKILAALTFCLFLSSCALLRPGGETTAQQSQALSEPFQSELKKEEPLSPEEDFEELEEKQATRISIQELPERKKPTEEIKEERVEIIWMVPKEPVDAFILKYGYSKYSLNFEKRIEVLELEALNDPQHGYVYKYILQPVETERTLFVSLATVSGEKTSAFSDVFSVAPLAHQDSE